MKLKRLDIHGFKSFYHRTTIAFDEGVTAVVGPNGCGKSNVVDSIKWVMGEQGARALRGNAMDDVIFNGSEKRGPMGMAEVCLTFINDGSIEIPARFAQYEELAIERRIERGGGSDYFINKQRCRLADVQELVAGTGVGSGGGGQRAYAIIEQGQIGRIVSAKADDRRVLIEEAAGITRYRTRRRLAEKKMEDTQQNLGRVDDILREVDGQLKSLRRQAKKAEKYKECRNEAEGIALRIAAYQFLELDSQLKFLQQTLEKLQTDLEDQERGVQILEAKRTALSLNEKSANDLFRQRSEALTKAEGEARIAQNKLDLTNRELQTLTRELDDLKAELCRCEERARELESERGIAAKKYQDLQSEESTETEDIERLTEEQKRCQIALLDAKAQAEALRRQQTEETRAIAQATARRDNARRRSIELRERLEESEQKRALAESNRSEAIEQIENYREELQQADEAVLEARQRLETLLSKRESLSAELNSKIAQERKISEESVSTQSRLRSLEELENRREGMGEGCKAVLGGAMPGVLGAVPELFDVPANLERAVAAALGDILKGALVENLETGLQAVRFLQERGRGRGVFLSASAEVKSPVDDAELPEHQGILGRLSDLIPGGEHPELVTALLSRTLVAETTEIALEISKLWPHTIVTLTGERFEGGLFVSGGAVKGDEAPLSRRREIKELHSKLDQLQEERTRLQTQVAEARQNLRDNETQTDQARKAGHEATLHQTEMRSELNRAQRDADRLKQEAVRLAESCADLRDRCDDALAETQEAEADLQEIQSGSTDRARAITEAEEAVQQAEMAKDSAVSALHEAKTAAVARKERLDAARDAMQRLERQMKDASERAERARNNREDRSDRLEALKEEAQTYSENAEKRKEDAKLASAELSVAREAQEAAGAELLAADQALNAQRKQFERTRDLVGEQRLAVQACSLKLEHLQNETEKRFHRDMGDILFDHHQSPIPTSQDKARLQELEKQIERLGDVNLHAIEECAEVEERERFLNDQKADLLTAMADLEKAIEEIDRTSRRLFKETFTAVNERFTALFPRLFRGGEAELVLSEPDKLLETGIEMLVRPPGKKVQNVALLSGGEKAMCAIALIFAVFQVKPSPFCLLDEVDAPLDEANIGRFNEVIREIAQMSQVVLITHNKRTMEIADVLYGVTMEESGISKLVSVRMS